MTTYNTGNAVPSTDVRDLLDNSQNLDVFSNGQLDAYADRLGVSRKSMAGMRTDFNAFLAASGFETTVLTYTDSVPLQVDRPTQLLERASDPGTLYSIKLPSSFPVVLSGNWATDEALLVIRVDQALRADLAASTGAGLIGFNPSLTYLAGTVGEALVSAETSLSELEAERLAVPKVGLGGDLLDRLVGLTSLGPSYVRGQTGTLIFGTNQADDFGLEYQMVEDADGLITMRGVNSNVLGASVAGSLASGFSNIADFSISATNKNAYTAMVGAFFSSQFSGTGVYFSHFSDSRGGLWSFTIDAGLPGETTVTHSVWSSVAVTANTVLLVDGLQAGQHTIKATFQGDDPLNAPSSSPSRGWFDYREPSEGTSVSYTFSPLSAIIARKMEDGGKLATISVNTILEFAMRGKAVASPAGSDWVPSHGGTPGATRNVLKAIYVDGQYIGAQASALPAPAQQASELKIVQTYDAYSTLDTGGLYKLWSGALTQKLTNRGLAVTHKITIASQVLIEAGYLGGMLGSEIVDTALLNNGLSKALTAVALDTNQPIVPASALLYTASGAHACAVSQGSLYDATGLGSIPQRDAMMFIQERTTPLYKAYWQRFINDTLEPGEMYRSESRIFAARGINPELI